MIRINKHNFNDQQIAIIEHHYKAKFVGDFCIKNKDGSWANIPVSIFYQDNPPESFSHYFGMHYNLENQLMITSGESAAVEPIIGIQGDNGNIIYSSYRHDFQTDKENGTFIDGGRDYFKRGEKGKTVILKIEKDRLLIKEK